MDEISAIVDAPDTTTRLGIRDRAMLHLCFAAALRVSELVTAQVADLSLRGTASLRVHGKGRRERCLPLWKQTTADLRAWLAVRGENPAPELFLNATDRPMSRAGFEYLLDKHVRTAATACPSLTGRSISPHQLRHSCALTMAAITSGVFFPGAAARRRGGARGRARRPGPAVAYGRGLRYRGRYRVTRRSGRRRPNRT